MPIPTTATHRRNQLLSLTDPAAVPAITQMLGRESARSVKILLIAALVQIGTPGALSTVVTRTLDDQDEEVRLSALDALAKTRHPELVSVYVQALHSKDNMRVNRAAFCLRKLGDKSAISPLIQALQTRHKFIEGSGNPGQMSTTFGSGPGLSGGGLSVGGGAKEVKVWIQNHEVLRALVALSGVNFEYNQQAWKSWYATQKKPITLERATRQLKRAERGNFRPTHAIHHHRRRSGQSRPGRSDRALRDRSGREYRRDPDVRSRRRTRLRHAAADRSWRPTGSPHLRRRCRRSAASTRLSIRVWSPDERAARPRLAICTTFRPEPAAGAVAGGARWPDQGRGGA